MDLYIANTKKQHQILLLRMAERRDPVRRLIRAGQQDVFRGLTSDHVGAIVAQLETHGAKRANEIKRASGFIGLAYEFDRPVSLDAIMVADEHNTGVLDQWGEQLRRNAAVGNNAIVDKALHGLVTASELEVIEDRTRTQRGETLIDRVRVERDGASPTKARRRKAA